MSKYNLRSNFIFIRVHEHTENPKMKFMTNIKLNDIVVSKGYGQNKKSSKTAAAEILLEIICPNILKEWKNKVKQMKIAEGKLAPEVDDSRMVSFLYNY